MQGLPYVRLDTSRHQFLQAGEDYLTDRSVRMVMRLRILVITIGCS